LHDAARRLLEGWDAPDGPQEAARIEMLRLLDARADAMWRSCEVGHLTGSALVVDAERSRALLTLHPKVGLWLQMGGHCDEGDADLAATAVREATEESGIDGLVLLPGPTDLDIHPIDCPRGRPNRHLDVRWIAVAPPGATERISAESLDLRWFPLDEPPELTDASTRRLFSVARAALAT
jgi:8-oxo-dGTP pyrophosphatase MutT (NUDIX family)